MSLAPWDYTMYCVDVWCMRRKSEDQCSIYLINGKGRARLVVIKRS